MDCNAITIVRGNDTNFNGANFLTLNLNTEILDLSTFKAVFTLGSVVKNFDDISSGTITINLTKQDTMNLPPFLNGVLQLIDNSNRIATIESLIPFKVISTVHGNAIATDPYTLNFDVEQGGETILTVNVESAVSVEVGTTTTLPAGSSATVTNVGTGNHLVLDFEIPQGEQGIQGERGLQGPQGIQGIQGATGPSGVAVSTTEPTNPDVEVWLNPNGTSDRYLVEVSSPSIMPSWYRVYSDGWCEQGGIVPITDTVPMPYIDLVKSYKDTNYWAIANQSYSTSAGATATSRTNLPAQIVEKDQIRIYGATISSSILTASWETKGFIEEESEE